MKLRYGGSGEHFHDPINNLIDFGTNNRSFTIYRSFGCL